MVVVTPAADLQPISQGLDADRSSGVIVVTDGVANVGNTQHAQFLALLETSDIQLYETSLWNRMEDFPPC